MKFNYQARTKNGEIQSGTVEASSKEAAIVLLQKHNLFVTVLEKAEAPLYFKKIKLFERVSKKEIVAFSRQLSIMFKSKITLVEALRVLATQAKNPPFQEAVLKISEEVEGGAPFSQALGSYPRLFSTFYVSMVRSGEASGTLSESLSYLAEHLEREYQLFARIKGAIIYPALILLVSSAVFLMMIFFVIPNLAKVLEEAGQDIPFLTRVSVGFAEFLRSWWWGLLLLAVAGTIFLFRYLKTAAGRKFFDRSSLKVPLIGQFLKLVYLSRFAENLSTLISGGLPIVKALEVTADIVGNDVYKTIILKAKEEVKRGEPINAVLSRFPQAFPPVFVQMTLVGEKTGTLGQSLMSVVDFYQKEVDRGINNLLALLEPLLIVFLGLVVGGLMISVLMPLYKMAAL